MVMNADIRTCNVTDGKEFLVAMDGRTFAFDEAVWCTEVNNHLEKGQCEIYRVEHIVFLNRI